MNRLMSTLFVVSLVLVGCGKKEPVDQVIGVADDDPKMNAAIAKARVTVNTFIAALNAPKLGQYDFAVKVPFKGGDQVEHIWITPVTFDGEKFHGIIANDVQIVNHVKNGQKVSVLRDEISDWMFIDKRKLVGGETIRALRDGLSEKEKEEFDKDLPFTFN